MADTVTTERYFDKDGRLVFGTGQPATTAQLKDLIPDSKRKGSTAEPTPINTAGKKATARTRAKAKTGRR